MAYEAEGMMAKMSWLATAIESALVWWFKKEGWTVTGPVPEPRKFVVIAAPHTSNWDFVYFIGATRVLGAQLSFMGKKQLFRWPFARAMKELGGIPVDRSSSQNYVDQMAAEFATRTEFMLTIAPEGTRGKADRWKSGFYHIAVAAKVPIMFGVMDYPRKLVMLRDLFHPTGDYEADLPKMQAYYTQFTPKFPHLATGDPKKK
jgi:1-acyl-sn-glycerol-3-phosphate acyltransferase